MKRLFGPKRNTNNWFSSLLVCVPIECNKLMTLYYVLNKFHSLISSSISGTRISISGTWISISGTRISISGTWISISGTRILISGTRISAVQCRDMATKYHVVI